MTCPRVGIAENARALRRGLIEHRASVERRVNCRVGADVHTSDVAVGYQFGVARRQEIDTLAHVPGSKLPFAEQLVAMARSDCAHHPAAVAKAGWAVQGAGQDGVYRWSEAEARLNDIFRLQPWNPSCRTRMT